MNPFFWTGSSSWLVNTSGGFGISLFDNGGVQAGIENQSTGLDIADTLNLGSNSSIIFTNLGAGSLDLNTPYIFASCVTGGLTGNFNTVNLLPSGFTIDYNYGGLNQIAIVPEPSSLLITILLSIPMVLRRKR